MTNDEQNEIKAGVDALAAVLEELAREMEAAEASIEASRLRAVGVERCNGDVRALRAGKAALPSTTLFGRDGVQADVRRMVIDCCRAIMEPTSTSPALN